MVSQGFSIGDRKWYVMCYYNIRSEQDLREVRKTLLASGCPRYKTDEAVWILSMWNKGFTYTDLNEHLTVVFISKTTTMEQMYDSIQHETKHVVEHIGEYYGVDPRSEEAAYLQGEVARKMFPAAAMVICPKCNER